MMKTDLDLKVEDLCLQTLNMFREDYAKQLKPNLTNEAAVAPMDGETAQQRLDQIYNRIKQNTERLQKLLDDLNLKMKDKKRGK